MTRRTDWSEYASPDLPAREHRRSGPDDKGSAGAGGGGYEGGLAGPGDGFGPADAASYPRHSRHLSPPYDPSPPYGMEKPYDIEAPYGDAPGDGPEHGSGPRGEGRGRRGGGRSRGIGGSGGSRGRRGRDRDDPPEEDGGAASSSRAEKVEPPRDPVEQARALCLRLLTGTPRTRKQLADALRKKEIPDEAAEEVLSRFEEVGLINDSAFAEAWVESRHHGRGLARRALARELRTKGVDSTLIDEAVSQLDSEQEEETARELVARKLRSTRGLDRDKRLRRLAGMLARKGYSQGMALKVVRQALEEEGEDTEFLGDETF
ncbi:recombination regulator RecX [Streptomyces ziwulingensis]|uniref:Regulatory protein RecX n=1 Tax=Streptomyces ziwulingensis TaxID=1045501 RepID=A0ABP9CXF8_9ACTN